MQFSLLKEIFGQPWHIDAATFQRYFPLALSVTRGTDFLPEAEPAENIPYKLILNTSEAGAVQWSTNEEDLPDEQEEEKPVNQPAISVIPVRGIMMKNDMPCGPRGTRTIAQRLKYYDAHENVIGHILVFETGGGSADSVPELAEAIEGCTKPVVAWVDGIMCSAGQYAGSYCDEIVASRPTDEVGSIGTMMIWEGRKANSGENFEGIIHQRIYADDATQKNEEFETAINDNNFKLVKERILNPHNQKFITDMKNNRPGITDDHLHGRVFYASEVIGALVDSIGDFDFAVDRIIALADFNPKPLPSEEPGQSKTNTHVKNMNYKHLQAVLGNDPLEFEADGRRTFTDDEMQTVENALAANSQETFQAAIDAERQTVETLKSENLQVKNDMSEIAGQLESANQQIEELKNENATLRQAPAAPPAIAPTITEPPVSKEEKEQAISDKYSNPMEALQEISEFYLNRKI